MHDVDLLIVSSGHAFFMMGWRSRLREATENNEQGSGSCVREAATRKGSWLARPSEAAFRSVVSTLATAWVLVFSSSPVYHYITLYLVPRSRTPPPWVYDA